MKIAVLGGGITGLTACIQLQKVGHNTTLYERSPVLGGLANGFKADGWDWPLERAYHHLFASDSDIISFAKEVGFNDIYFSSPKTDSLYKDKNNYRTIPVDSPQDFLRFPLLPIVDKVRAAAVLAVLKFLPFFSLYEKISAEEFTRKFMGDKMWEVFFQELFRKKFGKYAGNILASFLWARINKRTKKLGYIRGGFQALTDYLEQCAIKSGAEIRKGTEVNEIVQEGEKFKINGEIFDVVISTLPTPILTKVASKILPKEYLAKFNNLHYLNALVLILETDKPILEKSYWLNICTDEIPLMLVAQHTNLVDKKHYGGNHISYVGYYLERSDKLMTMSDDELVKHIKPHLDKLQTHKFSIKNTFVFKAPFAQPIFDKEFVKNKPDFIAPVKNFFIANLDMTYPYDRGTNYAVKLGKEVALHVPRM